MLTDNVFLLGFVGTAETILLMSKKLVEIFEPFDIEILKEIMNEFINGDIDFEYKFTIVDISKSLKRKGIITKQKAKDLKAQDEWYSFQNR